MTIKYKFLQIFVTHIMAFITLSLGGLWTWAVVAYFLVFGPLYALFDDDDTSNPDEDRYKEISELKFYRYVTYLFVPFHLGLILYGFHLIGQPGLATYEYIGVILSIGITGSAAIIVAHELIHRREKLERVLGGILLSTVSYATFKVEHTRGHHVTVSTPEDASSARYGQSFYHFLPRAMIRNPINGFKLEAKRLARKGLSAWSFENELIKWTLLTLALALIGWLAAGFYGVVYFVLQSAIAIALLELVNYVEHYGLERRKLPNGRYERVTPLHSWNSSKHISNILMLNLQRHSDHHANPMRRYQALRHFDESPQLPHGYGTMVLVALVPPLWFSMMNPLAKEAMNNIRQGFEIKSDEEADVNLLMDPEVAKQA